MFAFPFALLGALGIPVLYVLYRLQDRTQRVPVSSLMLWAENRQPRQGGLRLQKRRRQLLFYLELLILALLCLAAAGPRVQLQTGASPLLVVLDDSFSMQAGGESSPRSRAGQFLDKLLGREASTPVRLLLAGGTVRTLGDLETKGAAGRKLLDQWKPEAPTARLDDALSLALQLAGPTDRILVVSDHAPTQNQFDTGRIEWHAFGSPRANLAFVNAARSPSETGERVLLEVENLSDAPRAARLSLSGAPEPTRVLSLAPGEARRLLLELPPDTGPLHVQLQPDDLNLDNEVFLLPSHERPVRIDLRLEPGPLHDAVQTALEATQRIVLTSTQPDLLITDQAPDPNQPLAAATWLLRFLADPEATSHMGPFAVDRTHPLTRGLSLDGVVWGAGGSTSMPGMSLVTAGQLPLLTEIRRADGRHDIRLRFQPKLSNLLQTPDWPILFWNLVDWRASMAPGLRRIHLRLGTTASLHTDADQTQTELIDPAGQRQTIPVRDGVATVAPQLPGVYKLGGQSFAVNALARDESDLSGAASGRWGDWSEAPEAAQIEQSLVLPLLLAALALLSAHGWLIARDSR